MPGLLLLACQARLGRRVLRVIKVTPALQALLDPQDPRAIKVIPDLQARKDLQAHKAHVDQKDHEAPKAHRDLQVLRVRQARWTLARRIVAMSSKMATG
jgi:hypothetical protein